MLQVKKQLKVKRAESLHNITSEEGILLRMCRSIQVEDAFGLLKMSSVFGVSFPQTERISALSYSFLLWDLT